MDLRKGLAGAARKPASWIVAAVLAGIAALITSATTSAGRSLYAKAAEASCELRARDAPAGDRPVFTALIARLENDPDGHAQAQIAEQLLPTDLAAKRGCRLGPQLLDSQSGLGAAVRDAATRELTRRDADVLVWGRIVNGKAHLRFADRDGYCSSVSTVVDLEANDAEAARGGLGKAIAANAVNALLSDCQSRKLNALSVPQLRDLDRKVDYLAHHFDLGKGRFNLWLYRSWVKARLAFESGGEPAVLAAVGPILSAAPTPFERASAVWGLHSFAMRRHLPALERRALDEAYAGYSAWDRESGPWASMAMLARDRIETQELGDPSRRFGFYDHLTDLVATNDEARYVPVGDSEYRLSLFLYADSVVRARKVDRTEDAIRTFDQLLEGKRTGEPVSVTVAALEFRKARALEMSGMAKRLCARLGEARQIAERLRPDPGDRLAPTAADLEALRGDVASALTRSGCGGRPA